MKPPIHPNLKFIGAAILGVGLVASIFFWNAPSAAKAQNAQKNPPKNEPTASTPSAGAPANPNPVSATAANAAPQAGTNAPSAIATNALAQSVVVAVNPGATNAAPQAPNVAAAVGQAPPGPGSVIPPGNPQVKAEPEGPLSPTDEIPVSFQGAQVDMIVQWLAKTTGKSVVKHPRVQCQLTIVSSKKLPMREAVNLIYRALSLEGFTAIESSKSIMIVPENQEPKMNPELIDASKTEIPEGRQRLIKVFPLKNVHPSEVKDKLKPVLSEKATMDVDDRANQLIVTDYNDNLRLLGELIKELDVSSVSDSVIEIFQLKYSQAEDMASLLSLILNSQAGTPSSSSSSASSPSRPSASSSGPRGVVMMPGMESPPPGPSPPPSSGGGGAPQAQTGQIKLWPDRTANRLIVAAPKSRMPEVKKMIETLDVDKPADVAVRVIPLKVVSAEDLVKELQTLYQKMSGKSLKDTIEVTASSRANSLIVLSSEANFKAIEKLIASLDTEDAQEKKTQAFALKNADAEDVAKQLQELSQDQQSRYYYYYYPPSRGSSKKMNVVADRRRNTVIVQAPPGQMESLATLIKELDAPVTDNSLAPKIIALKYVSAVDIEDVLNELFLKKTQQRSYFFYDDYPQETTDRNVGRLYGKVRITSEAYSNSIIITANSQEHLAAVEEVLKQLDVPSQAGETTVRVGLKFAQSVPVATSINILFAKGGSPGLRPNPQQGGQPGEVRNPNQQPNASQSTFELEKETKEDAYYPWLGGQQENAPGRGSDSRSTVRPVSDLVGRVRVVPDRRSNALMVTANVHLLPQVLKLINDLDAPTAQVLIEAKIIEVSSDFRDKLGVRWSADGTQSFDKEDLDNSLLVRGKGSYENVFLGSKMANSLKTGILDSSLNLDFLIQVLRKNSDSKVLAEPHINIEDNELGKLFVGARVPFLSGSVNNTLGGRNDSFDYKEVGVILEVTPHINNSDEVNLRIRAESSNIRPGETLFGAAILDTRNFRTDLLVKSGETVVLGGILQRENVDTVRKVPVLGNIPGVGWAFKKKDKVSREVELMVFLRPKVTRTPQEAKALVEEFENKTPRIKAGKDAAPGGKNRRPNE